MTATKKTLRQFIQDVDTVIEASLMCSVHDLPDTVSFADYFDEDIADNPTDYKNMVLAAAEDLAYDNGFSLDKRPF